MKKLTIILFLLSLSCSLREDKRHYIDNGINDMIYFKDKRTNYCFARIGMYGYTYVPCEGIPEEMLYIADVNEK